jgi:hypothetical protein
MNPSILDHPLVSERYFYPRNEVFENPFWVDCGDVSMTAWCITRTAGNWYFFFSTPGPWL